MTAGDDGERDDGELPTLEGERLLLRPAGPGDVPVVAAILAEPDVARWWGRMSEDELRGHVEEYEQLVVVVDGEVGGWMPVWEEDDPNAPSVAFDIALTGRLQGRGYGPEALRLAIGHYIGRGHHRFTLDPAADNERAIRAYASLGFRPVGVMRCYERADDGTFRDALLMELLAWELVEGAAGRSRP